MMVAFVPLRLAKVIVTAGIFLPGSGVRALAVREQNIVSGSAGPSSIFSTTSRR